MKKVRVIAVDDEAVALDGLARLLKQDGEVDVIATCADGASALAAIRRLRPDIVFIDVQMPGMDGLEVIRAIGADQMPLVVFVTAFDRYAIDAFDAAAIDYLLKPFSDDRFEAALMRAKKSARQASMASVAARLASLLEQTMHNDPHPSGKRGLQRVSVRVGGRLYFIPTSEIDWIEGADYCSKLHAGGRGHLIRESLSSLAERLDPAMFLRVHRSAIVNINRIKEIQGMFHGEAMAVLTTGAKVRIARGRRAQLEALLETGMSR